MNLLLEESVSVQSHTDGVDEDLVDPGEPFIDGMVTELSGTDSEETTNSSKHAWFFGEFFVHKGGDRLEGDEPGSLDVIHEL